MAVDPTRVKSLFLAASDLPDGVERAAYLDRECGEDAELRARVEELLPADETRPPSTAGPADSTGTFAPDPDRSELMATEEYGSDGVTGTFVDDASGQDYSSRAELGTVIADRYTLVELIGEGGMGSVFLAEQSEPVQRQVALKLIKTGMNSKEVLARFDAERQALAVMDHPNIARIYDGGVTTLFEPDVFPAVGGCQPFFVMELVRGKSLTDYCDQHRLPIRSRLELFVSVCQAVQHAHLKGIIHRDLKPGNVLVTEVDGQPTPKVIDFGMAKALEQKLTEMSFADTGVIVGTPAYMSPEQADPSSMDIDTRTDVYALGVILYELLTGSPPFDSKQFKRGAILEVMRMVREVDPPRPSTKLSTANALPNIAANRDIEPAKLAKLLRGELDWVVMKALEKDRTRRYETAKGFARDIQRYLADEMVEARPPSRGYRLKKFVRRHKGQVIAASLVFLALLAGVVGTTLGLLEARRQADLVRGEAAEKEKAWQAEADQRAIAEAQGQRARTVAQFLTDTLKGAAPGVARGRDTTLLRDMVIEAVARLDEGELAADPEAEVELRRTVGEVFRDLADYPAAERHVRRAAELAVATFGPDDRRTADAEYDLAATLFALGRHLECLALAEKIRDGCGRRRESESGLAAKAWSLIGVARQNAAGGWTADAEEAQRTALEIGRKVYQKDDPQLASLLRGLAEMNYARAAYADAERFAREAHATYLAARGRQALETIHTACILADCQLELSDFAAAETLMRDALPDAEAVYGPTHPNVADVLWRLGSAIADRGDPQAAEPFHARCLDIRRATYKAPHKDIATALSSLATDKLRAGDPAAAEPLFRETVEMRRVLFGPETPAYASALEELGGCLRQLNRLDEAEKVLNQAVTAFRVTLPDPGNYIGALFELAMVAQARKDYPRAVDLFGQIVEVYRRQYGSEHIAVARALANRGTPQFLSGDKTGAEASFREALAIARKAGPTHPTAVLCLGQLQFVLEDGGDWAGAEPLARDAVEVQRTLVGANHPEYGAAVLRLGNNLVHQEKFAEAEPFVREALAIREKTQPDIWTTFNTQSSLGGVLLGQKKYTNAEPLLLKGYEGMKAREKTIPPRGKPRLTEALDRLIELYTATNKPDEVKKWRAERANYLPEEAPTPRQEK